MLVLANVRSRESALAAVLVNRWRVNLIANIKFEIYTVVHMYAM